MIWELSDLMEIKEASVAGPQRRSSRISVEGWLGRTFPASAGPTAVTLLCCRGPRPPSILVAFSDGLVPFTS